MSNLVVPIFMQAERPEFCKDCNMCTPRPPEDIPPGSKFTYYCLLQQKELTGRGIKAHDPKRLYRCHPNKYREEYCHWNGRYPIAYETIQHYNIDPTKIPI